MKVKEAPGGSVVGMYATQAWTRHERPRVYGDGGCFLFRARPDPVAYRWRPTEEEVADEHGDALLAEQFMVSCPTYLSMGGSKDGGCALRLNEDLTRGESAQAAGFHNDPLGGGGGGGRVRGRPRRGVPPGKGDRRQVRRRGRRFRVESGRLPGRIRGPGDKAAIQCALCAKCHQYFLK